VVVELPVPAAVDPAFWKPLPEDIAGFQRADVILLNGAGYGEWVETASLPPSKLVDTSRSFHDRLIRVEDLVRHSHGPEGEHSHAGTAFTTWLDPTLALEHARAVRAAFAELRPETEAAFETGFLALERDLLDLDERLRAIVARDPKRPLLASHPVYQYLARRYGLDLKSVHWEPDEAPLDEMWKELRALLASHPARWMLWEGRPLDETVRKLEALGVRSVVFAPCANVPEAGDWLDAQRENARSLEAVFAAEAPAR
jgi:zinc transport system substrate-binding protein